MFQKIERSDAIFQSSLFLKDAMAFSVVERILNSPGKYPAPKLFSCSQDCAIINSDPNHAVIVWTGDDFKEYDKLYDFIKNEFRENAPIRVMAKKAFYDFLMADHKIPHADDTQTLGVFSCTKLKDIPYNGHPDNAKPDEVEQVAQMLVDFEKETKEDPNAQIADCMGLAQEFTSNPTCCVWRDKDEKIVCIASNRKPDERNPRIGTVFTYPAERGKSYAKMLVHYLTSQMLSIGKIPMLFTDYDYEPSNRCYQAIGYELNCTIVKFTPDI